MGRSAKEMYDRLGISVDSAPDEIKKAYRKMALRFHPDKTGGQTTEEFKKIQEADQILSDPHKRRLYDTFGYDRMKKIEQFDSSGFVGGMLTNTVIVRYFLAFLLFASLLILLFLSLITIKLDHHKAWSWITVFIPFWLVLIPVYFMTGITAYQLILHKQLLAAFSVLIYVFWYAIWFTLPFALTGYLLWSSMWIFTWIVYIIGLIRISITLHPANVKKNMETLEEEVSEFETVYRRLLITTLSDIIWITLFMLLLSYKMCSNSTISYYAVFAPLYIYFLISPALSLLQTLRDEKFDTREKVIKVILIVVYAAFSSYTAIMISVKCQRELEQKITGPSAGLCALVLFFVLGILSLILCCATFIIPNEISHFNSYIPEESNDINVNMNRV